MQEIKKGWKKVKLNDICIKITDGSHYSPKSIDFGGYPMASVKDMMDNKLNISSCRRISKEDYLFLERQDCKPLVNDILIAKDGNTLLKHIFVNKKERDLVILSSIAILRPDLEKINPEFLRYVLLNPNVKTGLKGYTSGAAIPRIILKDFKIFEIYIPESLGAQQQIASILSKYDDLIENNNKRIKILEETAQAIYEEWFVKYHFPGSENIKMIDSGNDDFGMIPEWWGVRSILDIDYFRFINENIKKYEGEKVYYATADIDGISITGKGENFDFNSKPSRAQKEPILNSVWFARMLETYKVLGFTKTNEEIVNKSILSSGMIGFESEEFIFPFLYYTINSKDFHSIKNLYCTGATQRALTNDGLKQIKIIYPNKNIIEKYGEITKSMIDEMFLLQKQNKILKETRDLLIPRLASGDLDVESLDVKI